MATHFMQMKKSRPDDKYRLYFTGREEMRDEVKAQINHIP
jgi:hypothetical protein